MIWTAISQSLESSSLSESRSRESGVYVTLLLSLELRLRILSRDRKGRRPVSRGNVSQCACEQPRSLFHLLSAQRRSASRLRLHRIHGPRQDRAEWREAAPVSWRSPMA